MIKKILLYAPLIVLGKHASTTGESVPVIPTGSYWGKLDDEIRRLFEVEINFLNQDFLNLKFWSHEEIGGGQNLVCEGLVYDFDSSVQLSIPMTECLEPLGSDPLIVQIIGEDLFMQFDSFQVQLYPTDAPVDVFPVVRREVKVS